MVSPGLKMWVWSSIILPPTPLCLTTYYRRFLLLPYGLQMLVLKIMPGTHIFLHEMMIRNWLSKKVELLLSLFHKHHKGEGPTSKWNAEMLYLNINMLLHSFMNSAQICKPFNITRHGAKRQQHWIRQCKKYIMQQEKQTNRNCYESSAKENLECYRNNWEKACDFFSSMLQASQRTRLSKQELEERQTTAHISKREM